MILAEKKDKKEIINILLSSFADNPSVRYVSRNGGKFESETKALMDYSFEVCFSSGAIFFDNERKSCCLISLPHQKPNLIKSFILNMKIVFSVFGIKNIPRVLVREKSIKAGYEEEDYVYLWYIGTIPIYQKEGIGSALLNDIIKKYSSKTIYLETSVERNLSWYKKFGFEVYNVIQLYEPLYCLKRLAI